MIGLGTALFAVAAAASPPEVGRAEAMIKKYKYAEARVELAKARGASGLDRNSLLRILELQGVVAGQMRQSNSALQAFRELLTLDPGHKLDAEYAPRVTTPFLEAGQAVAEQGSLAFEVGEPVADAVTVSSLSVVVKDPMNMARVIVFHLDTGKGWTEQRTGLNKGVASVAASGPSVRWWAELLGDADAQLALLGTADSPRVTSRLPPKVTEAAASTVQPRALTEQPAPPPGASSSAARGVAYGVLGLTAVALAIGGVFGFMSDGAFRRITTAERDSRGIIVGLSEVDATRLSNDGARWGVIANGSFISAGVLAAIAAILWIGGAPSP